MSGFDLISEYRPAGDQPRAIEELVTGIASGQQFQTLLGVTGSGKTFTMANAIQQLDRPTLVISHNKTLAAQLYGEFQGYFPENAVEYFVSYYDYYQPEAYRPATDTYIEKEVDLNEEIDRLRLRAMTSLLERRDVVIVATVSCIFGLGSPVEFSEQKLTLRVGDRVERDEILRRLIDIYYSRNDLELKRGHFRVRGDIIEVVPAVEERAVRIELFGDEVEAIAVVDAISGTTRESREEATFYPAKAYVTDEDKTERACEGILHELEGRLLDLRTEDKLLEAHRLETRTKYDVEMIREIGTCPGIENYSRYMDGREPGQAPYVLMDYFPEDYLLLIDESHMTVPQIRAMWRGDRSRKDMLVEHGFRLPSAYDNRPLYFEEFEDRVGDTVFVSATPGPYELERSGGVIVEQVIRPTGLVDPEIEVRPLGNQVDDLMEEIRGRGGAEGESAGYDLDQKDGGAPDGVPSIRTASGSATCTPRSTPWTASASCGTCGLGSSTCSWESTCCARASICPRCPSSPFSTPTRRDSCARSSHLFRPSGGRARNAAGLVIFYADKMTGSMQRTIAETDRRRCLQQEFNEQHGIVPQTILRSAEDILQTTSVLEHAREDKTEAVGELAADYGSARAGDTRELLAELEKRMAEAAAALEFEKAAQLRDEISRLREKAAG